MFQRIIKPNLNNSFFLFGPRGTGKSTFLKQIFNTPPVLWFDLLDPELDDLLQRHPNHLSETISARANKIEWVVIDEVQKNPKLLNLVHQIIESSAIKFALTGSSARKLKHGHANLLAGRAFVNYLFPLTYFEMKDVFNLESALNWGTLPKITQLKNDEEKTKFLRTYALTYLKEEIWAEQFIRNLDPFRKFLEIAAQSNGEIINYSNISKDVGVDSKTIQNYFEILEDTLISFFLEPYHTSIRKQQRQSPKFYFFDLGVKKAIELMLNQKIVPNTYAYGKAFEHFMIVEIFRLNLYFEKDYKLYYLLTKDQAEIDLIIERPSYPTLLIEIKSTRYADERDTRILERFLPDFPKANALILSQDQAKRKIGNVLILPWQEGLTEIFGVQHINIR